MRRTLMRGGTLVLAVVLVFSVMVGPGLLALPWALLFGWIPAGARLAAAWHPTTSGIILFVLAALALVSGSHVFLRWLHAAFQAGHVSAVQGHWRWQWTLCVYGIGFFGLVAICCLVLSVHQLYWFSKSTDPLFADSRREAVGIRVVAQTLQSGADDAQWNASRTRAVFWQTLAPTTGRPALETFQPIWVPRDDQFLRAVVLVPRQPLIRARARLAVIQPGAPVQGRKLETLPDVLASFGIGGSAPGSRSKTELLP